MKLNLTYFFRPYPKREIIFPAVYKKANLEVFPKKNPTRAPIDKNCISIPKTKQIPNPINLSLSEREGKILSLLVDWPVILIKKSLIF